MWVTKGAGLGQKLVFNDEIATEHMTQSRRGGNLSGAVSEGKRKCEQSRLWLPTVPIPGVSPTMSLLLVFTSTPPTCYRATCYRDCEWVG